MTMGIENHRNVEEYSQRNRSDCSVRVVVREGEGGRREAREREWEHMREGEPRRDSQLTTESRALAGGVVV